MRSTGGASRSGSRPNSDEHCDDGSIALLTLDLDGFKQVNDVYGHAAGDELLCWVSATLKAGLQPRDAVGRFGGDEFVAGWGAGARDRRTVEHRTGRPHQGQRGRGANPTGRRPRS